jgi:streptomycin 6-kinase
MTVDTESNDERRANVAVQHVNLLAHPPPDPAQHLQEFDEWWDALQVRQDDGLQQMQVLHNEIAQLQQNLQAMRPNAPNPRPDDLPQRMQQLHNRLEQRHWRGFM